MRSSEKLANALSGIPGIPELMLQRASDGYYGDYTSDLIAPQHALIEDLSAVKLLESTPVTSRKLINAVIRDIRDGEYDGTKEEADEWAASPEGQETIRALLLGPLGGDVGPNELCLPRLRRRQQPPGRRAQPVLRPLRAIRRRPGILPDGGSLRVGPVGRAPVPSNLSVTFGRLHPAETGRINVNINRDAPYRLFYTRRITWVVNGKWTVIRADFDPGIARIAGADTPATLLIPSVFNYLEAARTVP